jgi:hypothetical protein
MFLSPSRLLPLLGWLDRHWLRLLLALLGGVVSGWVLSHRLPKAPSPLFAGSDVCPATPDPMQSSSLCLQTVRWPSAGKCQWATELWIELRRPAASQWPSAPATHSHSIVRVPYRTCLSTCAGRTCPSTNHADQWPSSCPSPSSLVWPSTTFSPHPLALFPALGESSSTQYRRHCIALPSRSNYTDPCILKSHYFGYCGFRHLGCPAAVAPAIPCIATTCSRLDQPALSSSRHGRQPHFESRRLGMRT